ncbi:MAG TPA: LytR C-terminal domain-containing protein [Gaiellaceae bacterium]
MEHSFELASPWRARAFLAAAIAAVELVVIVVIAVVLIARPLSHRMQKAAAARKPARAAAKPAARPKPPQHAMLSRGETSVLVLNGNGQAGAAGAEADQIRNLGYPIADVGNASHIGYTRTLVMYRPGYAAEAQRLARDAHIGLVSPLDGMRLSQLKGAHIAIVVGSSS